MGIAANRNMDSGWFNAYAFDGARLHGLGNFFENIREAQQADNITVIENEKRVVTIHYEKMETLKKIINQVNQLADIIPKTVACHPI